MVRGMTGFGRGVVSDGRFEIVSEISSVNKRHLDVTIRLPRGYQTEELPIRQLIGKHLHRGQVTITVTVRALPAAGCVTCIDEAWLESQLSPLRAMAEAVETKPMIDRAVFELWRRQLDEPQGVGVVQLSELMQRSVEEALTALNRSRTEEGKALTDDITKRLQTLADLKKIVAERAVGQDERIRQRLTELLSRHVPSLPIDDRVLREVVLYADKADVSEELSRIDHHLEQALTAFESDGSVGKLLEFILQELLREWNTLGSKTSDSEVSTCVVTAKTELEKMREQVQNVE